MCRAKGADRQQGLAGSPTKKSPKCLLARNLVKGSASEWTASESDRRSREPREGRQRRQPGIEAQASPAPAQAGAPASLLGTYPPLSTFAPILQPPGTPPLKSSLQIIKLEVRNADTPSESIYLESHKITPRTLIND